MTARRHAPATARNRDPILDVLKQVLPPAGSVLEIASGSGEHAVYFAPKLAPRRWIASDADPAGRASTAAWIADTGADIPPPLAINVTAPRWPVEDDPPQPPVTAIIAINLIHIAPWAACLGLLDGAARILPEGGVLYLYGPYKIDGGHTAPSNAAFDDSLRARNPRWGVRAMEDVRAEAARRGLLFDSMIAMPANNFSVIFKRG